jgi:hypothetical protein
MTDFLVIAKEEGRTLSGGDLRIDERLDGGEGGGDASLIVKKSRADKSSLAYFDARIEIDEVADFYPKQPRFFGA